MNETRYAVAARIIGYRRLTNTLDGAPRYVLYLDGGGIMKTAPNSQVGYIITNSEYMECDVTLHYTNRGVTHVTREA